MLKKIDCKKESLESFKELVDNLRAEDVGFFGGRYFTNNNEHYNLNEIVRAFKEIYHEKKINDEDGHFYRDIRERINTLDQSGNEKFAGKKGLSWLFTRIRQILGKLLFNRDEALTALTHEYQQQCEIHQQQQEVDRQQREIHLQQQREVYYQTVINDKIKPEILQRPQDYNNSEEVKGYIKNFVSTFLDPYLKGEMTKDQEPENRKSLLALLEEHGQINSVDHKKIALKQYMKLMLEHLIMHDDKVARKNSNEINEVLASSIDKEFPDVSTFSENIHDEIVQKVHAKVEEKINENYNLVVLNNIMPERLPRPSEKDSKEEIKKYISIFVAEFLKPYFAGRMTQEQEPQKRFSIQGLLEIYGKVESLEMQQFAFDCYVQQMQKAYEDTNYLINPKASFEQNLYLSALREFPYNGNAFIDKLLQEKVEDFVFEFLQPYITGRIVESENDIPANWKYQRPQVELEGRKPLLTQIMELPLMEFGDKEQLEEIAFQAYIKQAINGMAIREGKGKDALFDSFISENNLEEKVNIYYQSIYTAVKKDFPDKEISLQELKEIFNKALIDLKELDIQERNDARQYIIPNNKIYESVALRNEIQKKLAMKQMKQTLKCLLEKGVKLNFNHKNFFKDVIKPELKKKLAIIEEQKELSEEDLKYRKELVLKEYVLFQRESASTLELLAKEAAELLKLKNSEPSEHFLDAEEIEALKNFKKNRN